METLGLARLRDPVLERKRQDLVDDMSKECEMFMMTSKAYPDCPECDGINYPTFDHETGKFYLKCHSCGYDSRI